MRDGIKWMVGPAIWLSAALSPACAGGPDAPRVDFETQVRPILQEHCLKCHSRGKYKGGLSLETRDALLKGGEEGPAAVSGKSGESLLIALVEGHEEGRRMPDKGAPLKPEQIATLRAWIDGGLAWPKETNFGFRRASVQPRKPEVPASPAGLGFDNPIDRFVASYARQEKLKVDWTPVDDRRFARRAYLDLIGMIPTPEQLSTYETDQATGKESRLVAQLLGDRQGYADHWLTFWNDALRNAYRGAGFIDGGRKPITQWLYKAIYDNMPYDQFVRDLIRPVAGSEGFTKGIVWRGVVNASQTPAVQAAQNVSQVFLATNLKCASCHDSFVNHWKLTDAYALAAVFSEGPLEINRCDKPAGQTAKVGFIYPELGSIDPKASRIDRMARLGELVTARENGRFSRTIVNRLWASLMGRGLVEPLDDLDQAPWSQDLLDWLADDFATHGHDLKHTLALIASSRTYRLATVGVADPSDRGPYRFRGPLTRRMTAEQFADALSTLTGVWPKPSADMTKVDGRGQGGQVAAVRASIAQEAETKANSSTSSSGVKVDAHWIWSHAGAQRDSGGRILIRKVVTLKKVPAKALIAASCDNELVFYVNGRKVAESSDWNRPALADVTALLKPGDNVFAVEATNWPDPINRRGTQFVGANPAGFLGWIGGFDGAGGLEWGVGSDASWLWAKTATGDWKARTFKTIGWSHAVELPGAERLYAGVDLAKTVRQTAAAASAAESVSIRAALAFDDPLLSALGRPSREQVVTRRDPTATTLQALEMTNGTTLDAKLKTAAEALVAKQGKEPRALIRRVFVAALGRDPLRNEEAAALDLLGAPVAVEGVQDLLWTVAMLPEFQLIR